MLKFFPVAGLLISFLLQGWDSIGTETRLQEGFPGELEDEPAIQSDHVFDSRVKTVQLYREGWNLSYPVIKLFSDDKLTLQFDITGDISGPYYYTFMHCTKEWGISGISPNDFLEGFPDNEIEDFKHSFNTTVHYMHYKLTFPNDKIQIKVSGNYIIKVYEPCNPEMPVLTRRFMVTESSVKIDTETRLSSMPAGGVRGQQVILGVDLAGLDIIDQYENIYSFILQNGRWDNAVRNLKPDIHGNNKLEYNSFPGKNIFRGGNEFRFFDIRSIRYQSEFIRRIDYMAPYYNIYLVPSENREFKPYFYRKDFNGKYYIAVQEGKDADTEADYVNVFFTLPSKYIIRGGDMYVSGGLSNWSFEENNRMTYNPDKGQYECTMLLKQGVYDYVYAFAPRDNNEVLVNRFEGDHHETENDYLVLVYYRNPRQRYDRIIGSATANTLNRLSF
jgi:hypothetical protein